ncbi:DUF2591 family protein [Klebsiella variicola]|nr:phage protein NinX family protein [Klebsiella variicola]QOV59880.1 DUF2591 family protein [Klebsiella variicola]
MVKKVKTEELSGVQLDYAVAASVNVGEPILHITSETKFIELKGGSLSPSVRWGQCGPLIDKHSLSLTGSGKNNIAVVRVACGCVTQSGDTLLIAFCRALVAAKLGDEVDIPDELID